MFQAVRKLLYVAVHTRCYAKRRPQPIQPYNRRVDSMIAPSAQSVRYVCPTHLEQKGAYRSGQVPYGKQDIAGKAQGSGNGDQTAKKTQGAERGRSLSGVRNEDKYFAIK